ncbi:MAG: sulfide/dihydroorotate dehydrogenase-like FAD/NAD-binding protein [Deltaproteobacteria bacterium]|nr:sulfide/dihydroorotate dehydrogenase-like FAD/NAD-binding protein [Deltaproteobacteria bacterium]
MDKVTFKIDGIEIVADKGTTILESALQNGIDIPHLCYHPELQPDGACRLCVVNIEGVRGFPTSCTTPAADGMVVKTNTPEIFELRRNILKLMLSGHTSPCMVCPHREPCETYRPAATKSGKATRCAFCSNKEFCELRKLADQFEIDDLEVPILYKNMDLERNDPFMDRDYNLCVLCGRCVRICKKIHGKAAIEFINRGKDARIGTAFNSDHIESGCLFCGACVDICPTGALSDRFAKWYGHPDKIETTRCILCPLGCALNLKIKDEKIIGATATSFSKEARVCAIGRFVYPQIFENPNRLLSHKIRTPDGLRKASYQEAVSHAVKKLENLPGEQIALIAHPAASREEIHIFRKFLKEVLKSNNFGIASIKGDKLEIRPESLVKNIETGKIKTLIATGDHIDSAMLEKIENKIIIDILPSRATESADVVFGAAVLAETDGTFLAASGDVHTYSACVNPPENLHPDWKVICDIAKTMGAAGFDFNSASEIQDERCKEIDAEQPPAMPDPSPLDALSALPKIYRGHLFTEISSALNSLWQSGDRSDLGKPQGIENDKKEATEHPFKIVEKKEIVPNTHLITVYAPAIAKKCKPGQFVIAMVNEQSERVPYTLCDWDPPKGTVTLNVLEAGKSSREMALLREGDCLKNFVGPLGNPVEIKKYGTVICGGGCFGVGAILPIAAALKETGNRVICIEEASSGYLLYWQDKLKKHCDELIIATKDGSCGIKGGIQEAISMLVERGEKIDQAFIIGCLFMMKLVSDVTKKYRIPTLTALNPIMLDGTGMCGACRISVGNTTKFACVDGPFLDGHLVQWDELMQRLQAFTEQEKHQCRLSVHTG